MYEESGDAEWRFRADAYENLDFGGFETKIQASGKTAEEIAGEILAAMAATDETLRKYTEDAAAQAASEEAGTDGQPEEHADAGQE